MTWIAKHNAARLVSRHAGEQTAPLQPEKYAIRRHFAHARKIPSKLAINSFRDLRDFDIAFARLKMTNASKPSIVAIRIDPLDFDIKAIGNHASRECGYHEMGLSEPEMKIDVLFYKLSHH